MADAGQVRFHAEDASGRNVRERQVGFVFQHYALFRHMTVFDNIAFGLQVKARRERPSKADIRARSHEFDIDRYSPGQAGLRAQLVRALAVGPVARLELEREDNGEMIEVEMPIDLYRKLKLHEGESLVVMPRRMQVFLKSEAVQP